MVNVYMCMCVWVCVYVEFKWDEKWTSWLRDRATLATSTPHQYSLELKAKWQTLLPKLSSERETE